MDQTLLDTARYNITMFSVDSRFADKYYSGTGDFQIKLPSPMKNIMRVALSSVEIPNVEWLFSATHGNITFEWKHIGYAWNSATISQGNYTPDEFAAAISAAMGAEFTVTVSSITGLMTITKIGGPAGEFSLRLASTIDKLARRRTHWGIGYYMGFRERELTSVGGVLTGTSIVLTQTSAYYLVQLMTPDSVEPLSHRLADGSWVGAFAKIALRDGTYTIDFDDGGNMLRKENTYLSPVNITNIRVRVIDPFGDTVNLLDMDWSLTLELYEVMNSRVYSAISETYGRK